MQLISRGYILLSLILSTLGFVLGRLILTVLPEHIILFLVESKYNLFIIVFGLGIPFAVLNILECKYIWARLLGRNTIDLLGVNIGFLLGIASVLFL